MTEITDDDRIKCVERELALRRRVYPRWIDKARMTWPQAEREIKKMESILGILKNLKWINEKEERGELL